MKFHLELSAPFQGPCSPKRPPPPSLKTTALPTHLVWVVGQMRKILSLSTTHTQTQVESEQRLAGGGREDKRVISTQMSLGNLLFLTLYPYWNIGTISSPPPSSNTGDIWLNTSI